MRFKQRSLLVSVFAGGVIPALLLTGILLFSGSTANVGIRSIAQPKISVPSIPPQGKALNATDIVRFAVIGDYGNASKAAEGDVANLVKSWNPDFIITTGDNNYPLGDAATIDQNIGQYYHEFIYPYVGAYGSGAIINRFFPSPGNHDWDTGTLQPYIDYFTLPGNERYYEFVRGPLHLFAIDSDSQEPDGRSSTSTQANWLRTRLAASTSPWQLVYMHHAPYSSSANHGSIAIMQWPYQEWGADVVLAGHDHTYERIIRNGLPYFVNGLGGNGIYSFGSPITGSEVRFNGDNGAMLVQADASSITFQFITRAGTVIDTYTLDAASTATPTFTPAVATATDTPTADSTLTATPTAVTPTDTPTADSTLTATPAIATATDTPTAESTPTPTPTVATSTDTPTAESTLTATPSATSSPNPTSASDLLFADDFETGTLSRWSANVSDGGDLSAAQNAALGGSYGLSAVIDDNNTIYVTDVTPNAETRYRARFYFDPNSIGMANGDTHYFFYGYAGKSTPVLRIGFRRSSNNYQLRASFRSDSGSWTNSSWFTLSDAPHAVEFDWRASTANGARDGGLTLWLDGTLRANLTGVDNDARRIDHVRLGAIASIDSGTRGTYYFDSFESRRETFIGP